MKQNNGMPQKVYCVILHSRVEKSTIAIHTEMWSERPGSTNEETVQWQIEGLIANFNLEHKIDSVVLSEEENREAITSGEIIDKLRRNLEKKENFRFPRTEMNLPSVSTD